MNKTSKFLLIIWVVLALLSFVSACFIPVMFWKVVNFVFGGMNTILIISGISMHERVKGE